MPTWTRQPNNYLTKSAKITDGEMLHLLLGISPNKRSSLDDRLYAALQSIKASTSKALAWLAGSCAFGGLAHFGAVESAGASGINISSTVFSPTALLAISLSTAWLCFAYCKQTYLQSWFYAKLRQAEPSYKAEMLALYPQAYWHFHYLPLNIGFPKYIYGHRKGYAQLIYLILFLIALTSASIGSIALWVVVALDVAHSTHLTSIGRVLVITLGTSISLLGWTSPFFYDWPRKYKHHGLVGQLTRLEGNKRNKAHRKIASTAVRMNLISRPDHPVGR